MCQFTSLLTENFDLIFLALVAAVVNKFTVFRQCEVNISRNRSFSVSSSMLFRYWKMSSVRIELLLFLFQLKGCAHVNITVFNEHCSVAGCARTITLNSVFPVILLLHPLVLHIALVSMMTFCISGQQIWGLIAVASVFTLVIFCFSAGFMMVSVVVLIFNP